MVGYLWHLRFAWVRKTNDAEIVDVSSGLGPWYDPVAGRLTVVGRCWTVLVCVDDDGVGDALA